jgi:RNA polymerase-binding protein DksA
LWQCNIIVGKPWVMHDDRFGIAEQHFIKLRQLRFNHFFKVSAGHLFLSLCIACKSHQPCMSLTTAPRVPTMSVWGVTVMVGQPSLTTAFWKNWVVVAWELSTKQRPPPSPPQHLYDSRDWWAEWPAGLAQTTQGPRTAEHSDGMDEGDRANRFLARELDLGQKSRDRALLTSADAALKRISEGTFGQCLNCEQEINPKRLEANPLGRYCISCQELIDGTRCNRGDRYLIGGLRPATFGFLLSRRQYHLVMAGARPRGQ